MSSDKKSSSFLDNLIKVLTLFLLLGLLVLVGFNIRDKVKESDKNRSIVMEKQIKITPVSKEIDIEKIGNKVDDKESEQEHQRVYTEEEMQEILQTMIDEMETNQSDNTIEEQNDTKISNTENDLGKRLEDIEVDKVDDEENISVENIKKVEAKKSDKEQKIHDTYNKVEVSNSNYSDKNIESLTKEIGALIKNKNEKTSNFTSEISKEVEVRKDAMRIIVVKRGDTLSMIAKRAYGNSEMFKKILKANRDLIKNPNRIYVGQKLRVPTM